MPRILWINPLGTDVFDAPIRENLRSIKREGTEVDVVSFASGPKHLEYRYYEALVIPDILRTIKRAETEGYDAAIIGCFYDPGLHDARSIAESIAIVGPCEASAHIAAVMGRRLSVLVTEDLCIPQMMDNLTLYGLKDRLASFRSLDIGVLDLHRDEERTARRIREEARLAVEEDGADVLILGCTIQFGFYKSIQEQVDVPVIDASIASFKHAELLAELKNGFGWMHSKRNGYASPPASEIAQWNLDYTGTRDA